MCRRPRETVTVPKPALTNPPPMAHNLQRPPPRCQRGENPAVVPLVPNQRRSRSTQIAAVPLATTNAIAPAARKFQRPAIKMFGHWRGISGARSGGFMFRRVRRPAATNPTTVRMKKD